MGALIAPCLGPSMELGVHRLCAGDSGADAVSIVQLCTMQGLSGPLCCVARPSPGAWSPPVLLLGFNNLVGSPLMLCGCSTIRVDTFVWRTT